MKVLLIHKTKVGGVAIHVKYLKKYLEKENIEAKEITRVEDLKLGGFVRSYQKMKELFKKWSKEYDIIHAHDWSIAYPAIKSGIENLVVTLHGLPTNIIAKFFEDKVAETLRDRVVVVSPKMLKYYPKATYIPNGVDLEIFKRQENIEREKNTIGIAQNYNKDLIIKIAGKLRFNVKIAKDIPHEKMSEFYSSVDIFVSIPPKTTGFNMVWLEAMACEVPYIIGTSDGIGEILPIYKVEKINELKTILKLIKENELPSLYNTREFIKTNNFTWENHVKKLLRLYNRLLNY